MSDLKLKPCPFCGSNEIHISVSSGDDDTNVQCFDCGAEGPSAFAYIFYDCADPTAEMVKCAVENWNKRSGDGDE